MPFTTEIKNEICQLDKNRMESLVELSAFIRNDYSKVTSNKIELLTENPKVAKRIYLLFKSLYDVTCIMDNDISHRLLKRRYYTLTITDNVSDILSSLNIVENDAYLVKPKDYFVETEEEKRAYLRGVFLKTGSINDPKTARYHLELMIDKKEEAEYVIELLNYFNIKSKALYRENGYMVYVKKAEKIADFLRIIEANRAVLYFEDIRIYRDHKNMTNRLNNCEQANIDKVIESANKQIDDIDKLLEKYEYDALDEKIKEIIDYRKKYPEASLMELSKIMSFETGKEITKSGLNHRFRKIKGML
ncbi:MAG TPA: DNA-binding protein WhiA [Bacilli bacterium]|nr:DNA-binding protein WhiA [Bacilli bacterium]